MPTQTIGTGGDFDTLQEWSDAIPTTPSEPYIGQVLNDLTVSTQLNIGSTDGTEASIRGTTSSNYIELRPAPGLAWNDDPAHPGRPGSGIKITFTAHGGSGGAILIFDPHVRFRNLQVVNLIDPGACLYTWSYAAHLLAEGCIFVADQPSYFGVVYCHGPQTIRNNLICNVNTQGSGLKCNDVSGVADVLNNTFVRPAYIAPTWDSVSSSRNCGIYANPFAAPRLANNAFFGFLEAVHSETGSAAASGSGGNATDLAAFGMTGVSGLTGLPYADQFVDRGSDSGYLTSMDFSLPAGSALVNAGVDLSAAGVTVDARGAARPSGGAYDVGAFEYPVPYRPYPRAPRNLRAGGRPLRLA